MTSRTAETVLDEAYLPTRASLLEIAAVLDRIDRAAMQAGDGTGNAKTHSELDQNARQKRQQLLQAIAILTQDSSTRAEEIQQLFSRSYNSDWRIALEMPPSDVTSSNSTDPRSSEAR